MDAGAKLRLQGHYGGLYAFAISLSRNGEEARDLVQETAVKALAAANVPEDGTAFRVWLFRILHNSWRDRVKRVDFKGHAPLEDADGTIAASEWISLHERKINVMAIRSSFTRLSRDHQQVLGLIDVAGLKYEEASQVLGIPRGTIMSRLARARQSLLVAMDEVTVIPISTANKRSRA